MNISEGVQHGVMCVLRQLHSLWGRERRRSALLQCQVRCEEPGAACGQYAKCSGSGPVDVHLSHRARSALVVTQWSSHPLVACVKCGTKAQLRNAGVTLLLGWWGLPWGLIMTPVQIGKNIYAVVTKPDPRQPTAALYCAGSSNMAAQALASQR